MWHVGMLEDHKRCNTVGADPTVAIAFVIIIERVRLRLRHEQVGSIQRLQGSLYSRLLLVVFAVSFFLHCLLSGWGLNVILKAHKLVDYDIS